jgi:pimeloyl-ACP methyl ester carboxylesterase
MRRRVGAIDLGVEVTGSGPALVLLHAFPLDRRMWAETVKALSPTHRVIALDARGFGESALGDDPPALEHLADDVVGLLDLLGVPMAAVLGLSMGGYVALALAARHPARLASLILCDTRAGADSEAGKRARDQAIADARADLSAYLDAMPQRLFGPTAEPAPPWWRSRGRGTCRTWRHPPRSTARSWSSCRACERRWSLAHHQAEQARQLPHRRARRFELRRSGRQRLSDHLDRLRRRGEQRGLVAGGAKAGA